jgi:hypothetical protein
MKILLILCSLVLVFGTVKAQELCTSASPDYLFVPEGHSMVSAATGIPYVGIGEYAYGISNKTTLGFILGQTPVVTGLGFRIRTVVAEPSDRTRVYFRSPLFYYPQTHDGGKEPWFLAWPVLNAEYRRDCGRREWFGLGVVGAVCAHSLGHTLGLEKELDMSESRFEGGLWNTVQVGLSQPITESIVAQAEAALVLKGVSLPKKGEWIGGPPVILVMGVSYAM